MLRGRRLILINQVILIDIISMAATQNIQELRVAGINLKNLTAGMHPRYAEEEGLTTT